MNYNIKFEWKDLYESVEIVMPKEFRLKECLVYIDRSRLECLHRVIKGEIYKFLRIMEDDVLFKISAMDNIVKVTFLNTIPREEIRAEIAAYVWNMFDPGTDLGEFYKRFKEEKVLGSLIKKYYGLRIIKMEDLFETICWAIIGQQINLNFAYTLKKRLVEKYGQKLIYENEYYWSFPEPRQIAALNVEDLRKLKFTSRKSEYIIGLARLFVNGCISKEELMINSNYNKLFGRLLEIKGVGGWTADYTILKCFNMNCAFPAGDVGVQNALKRILNLDKKPDEGLVRQIGEGWRGWEAYAVFYLWRSLYDE